MSTLLVVGATGALGRAITIEALGRGLTVRALVRDPARLAPALRDRIAITVGDARDPEVAARAVAGAELVLSCAGASVLPGLRGWRSYAAVDWPLNHTLFAAAARAGARRAIYVSVHHPPAMRGVGYVAAHERVAAYLRRGSMPWAVIRPTGFFSAVGAFVALARRGAFPEIGDGRARTNPIADQDLGEICVDAALARDPALEVAAGGPDVVTRRELAELAFAAVGAAPRFRRIPAWLVKAGAIGLRPLHPRMSQFAGFMAALAQHDAIAPVRGQRRIADHFAAIARAV